MYLVLSTCPPGDAERIARVLVEGGFAACVNASAVTSTYRWKGALATDGETLLVIKVAAAGLAKLRDKLGAIHPYELPEIVALPVDVAASSAAYVSWVRDGSRGATDQGRA